MLSMNRNCLAASFPICIHFISFSCLTALARPSSTMSSNGPSSNGKACQFFLIPDLNGENIPPFGKILTMGFFTDAVYQVGEALFLGI